MALLSVLTLNVHKGFSPLHRGFVLGELREALRGEKPDLVFLQEVVGEHAEYASKIDEWPATGQYEFLADQVWSDHAYAQNAAYIDGHHGNAILSRYPILSQRTAVLSATKFEQRSLLHVVIDWPGSGEVHLCCVHLGMFESWRSKQLRRINEYVAAYVPSNAPLIVAGDFNDWRGRANTILAESSLAEAHFSLTGKLAKTFPSILPVLRMDRIYARGLRAEEVNRVISRKWRTLSDHLPLRADLRLANGGVSE